MSKHQPARRRLGQKARAILVDMTPEPNVPLTPAPDGPRRGRTDWVSVARRIRKHPGQWYRLEEPKTIAVASQIRTGRIPAFTPAGHYEAAYQRLDPAAAKVTIWVRFTGGEDYPPAGLAE